MGISAKARNVSREDIRVSGNPYQELDRLLGGGCRLCSSANAVVHFVLSFDCTFQRLEQIQAFLQLAKKLQRFLPIEEAQETEMLVRKRKT